MQLEDNVLGFPSLRLASQRRYSVTCLNRIPMGPNILSGLDMIRITQTRLFVKNFCIVVALMHDVPITGWNSIVTYYTSFQLLTHFQTKKFFSIISP